MRSTTCTTPKLQVNWSWRTPASSCTPELWAIPFIIFYQYVAHKPGHKPLSTVALPPLHMHRKRGSGPRGGGAHRKSAVAMQLAHILVWNGGFKIEKLCGCMSTQKGGKKTKDVHTIWAHYHKCTHKLHNCVWNGIYFCNLGTLCNTLMTFCKTHGTLLNTLGMLRNTLGMLRNTPGTLRNTPGHSPTHVGHCSTHVGHCATCLGHYATHLVRCAIHLGYCAPQDIAQHA